MKTLLATLTLATATLTAIYPTQALAQQPSPLHNLTRNEKLVVRFYDQLFGDKDVSAIDRYLTPNYIQHNPGVADGREPLKAAVGQWFANAKKEKVNYQHIGSKGDIVFLHVKSTGPDGKATAIVDIFRVENGKIAEHWDVIQQVPEKSANPHPMF